MLVRSIVVDDTSMTGFRCINPGISILVEFRLRTLMSIDKVFFCLAQAFSVTHT